MKHVERHEEYFELAQQLLKTYPSLKLTDLNVTNLHNFEYCHCEEQDQIVIPNYDEIEQSETIECLNVASVLGNGKASYQLAVFYSFGETDEHLDRSIKFLVLASEQGYGKASYELGYIYFKNGYVEYDEEKAISYLKLAKEQGHKLTKNEIDYFFG